MELIHVTYTSYIYPREHGCNLLEFSYGSLLCYMNDCVGVVAGKRDRTVTFGLELYVYSPNPIDLVSLLLLSPLWFLGSWFFVAN